MLLELEVQELKDKVKQLEDGQRLMMNWISRLESLVANIPPPLPPTTPSTIHTEPSTVYQSLPPTTPSTIQSTVYQSLPPTTPSTMHTEPSTFYQSHPPTTPSTLQKFNH